MMKKILILPILALLCSCGFAPMYENDTRENLSYSVDILPIAGVDGIELRNRLKSELNPFGEPENPKYKLHIDFKTDESFKGIQKTGDASWQEIDVRATFKLSDNAGKELFSSRESVSESYPFVDNLISSNAAKKGAVDAAIKVLSEKISFKVKVFLGK
jgi:hypothetical protein